MEPGDTCTIDNKKSINFTGTEDFEVKKTEHHDTDEGSLTLWCLGDFYLACSNFSGLPKFFILEIFDEVATNLYLRNDRFTRKIRIETGSGTIIYQRKESRTADNVSLCEYRSKNYFNYILLKAADTIEVFRGFEIDENDIVI